MTALIFDLDGTLWDTAAACAQAWNQTLKQLNLSLPAISPQTLRQISGLTSEAIRQHLFSKLPPQAGRQILKACFAAEIKVIRQQKKLLYLETEATLSTLAQTFPLYLVSNCDSAYLTCFLALHPNIAQLLQDSLCYGQTGLPKGQTLQLLKTRHQLTTGIYIGDTASDQQAAAEAGLDFIFAAYGFGQIQHPALSLSQLRDLPKLLQ